MFKLIFAIAMIFSFQIRAATKCTGIFPKNDLWIPADSKSKGITQDVFNQVIDRMEFLYTAEVATHGGYPARTSKP